MNETQLQYNLDVLEEIRNPKEGWFDGRIDQNNLTSKEKQASSDSLLESTTAIKEAAAGMQS